MRHIAKYDVDLSTAAGAAINWVANQMIRAVSCKKEFLRRVKPGAITTLEPKFVWVQMLKYDESADDFNNMLEEILEKKELHYIIKLADTLNYANLFTHDHLNGEGKVKYWMEINYQLELFDTRQVSLKPLVDTVVPTQFNTT